MRRYFFGIAIIFLAIIIFLTAFFIKKERSFRENIRLKQENEELWARLKTTDYGLQTTDYKLQTANNKYLIAKVFSTYPFNIKNQITVNAGEKYGVKKMAPVVLGNDILVGQVVEIFENYSVVKTIFDPNWQLPVRIGKDEINGLFHGGGEPRVVLIDKEKLIQAGDIVFSASSEFPYGLKIGEILEVRETSAGVFKEAILKMPFNMNELRTVGISI